MNVAVCTTPWEVGQGRRGLVKCGKHFSLSSTAVLKTNLKLLNYKMSRKTSVWPNNVSW